MKLNNFKLVHEDNNAFHVLHPGGQKLVIPKKGLSDKAHEMITKLAKGGSVSKMAEGGDPAPLDLSVPQSVDQPEMSPGPGQSVVDPRLANIKQSYEQSGLTGGLAGSADSRAQQDLNTLNDLSQKTPEQLSTVDQSQLRGLKQEANPPPPKDEAAVKDETKKELEKTVIDTSKADLETQAAANKKAKNESEAPYNMQLNAIQRATDIQGKQAEEERQIYHALNDSIKQMPTQNDIVKANAEKDDALMKAYQSKTIDPNRYLNNLSTGNKITTGLALLLGGVGGHGANGALDVVQNSINQDIDAQKNEQGKSMNLWQMNRNALGTDLAANLATQNQMYVGVLHKLDESQASFKGPMAQQNAQIAKATIMQQMQKNRQLLGLQAGLQGKAGNGSEQDFASSLSTARAVSPEMAKEAEEHYMPGVGITRVPVTKEDRSGIEGLDDLNKQVDEAMKFAKETGTTYNPWGSNAQHANDLMNNMQLNYNKVAGLKRINAFEGEKFEHLVPNPGKWNTTQAIQQLSDFKNTINKARDAAYNSLGVTPFRKSSQDAQALMWAKQNPNDPRSAAILQQNGIR